MSARLPARSPTEYAIPMSAIEDIRKRPGMYIGDVHDGSGLHHMLWEVVANALDQHLAGNASRIDVMLNENGSVTVDDDGPGMPIHVVDGAPFAQLALTTHHTTGTLDGHAPHAHVGLHGVGVIVVNALSTSLVLDVFREGHHYRQTYAEGIPQSAMERVEPTARTGTRLTFVPDATIFRDTEMSFEVISTRLRELALLNTGLRIELRDDRRRRRSYFHPEGLRGFVDGNDDVFTCQGTAGDVRVDVALRWKAWGPTAIHSFANNEPTTGHGTHVDGLLRGIADAVVPELAQRKRHSAHVREVFTHALQAAIHVNLADPRFSAPTKDQLASPAVADAVRSVVADQLARQLEARPTVRTMLIERVTNAARR